MSLDDGDQFERWAQLFEEIGRGPTPEMREEWAVAGEMFFGESQSQVHVLSGFLKDSGSYELSEDHGDLVVELTYEASAADLAAERARADAAARARNPRWKPKRNRKPPTNYAEYEHERGGQHAWLNNSFAVSARRFERALARGYERTVRRWS